MKVHTNEYKDEIKKFGRQLDSIISYTINGVTIELGSEELNSITPHYEANILKSVMKQLDIDSNIDIPLETEINYQFGVLVNGSYEYVNFGNYIVYSSEKQEDLNSYKIICYDKILLSMKDYENINVTYPITIRNYINAICTHLGLTFKNTNDIFPNYNRQISRELYLDSNNNSLGYTFRDVLDEIAQATGSTICINEEDNQLELRYITDTNDTINAEYLKDININFKEKYGPINSIVLSRSAESDNVYLRDESSISENGLCELKIIDNQIMNWNDRSDYLPDLLNKLGGLEYYLNDFISTGITYYNMCDKYTINIEDNYYPCVMFNDEVLVTQGLEENINTDMPNETKTDYTKADKTDRKINQTYLLVDKQNQEISAVISQTTDPSNPDSMFNKVTSLNLRVGELESKISDVADLTISGETSYATLDLNNINASEPIMVKVHATNDNISYLYPRSNLYPSDTLYMTDRIIRFHNNTTNENFDYTLPDDLLIYDNDTYDEFYLNFDTTTCQIVKRCGYNADGTVYILANEITTNYTYPRINLTDGNYTISLLGYNNGYLFTRLLTQNIYTTQFYTRTETNSIINQTTQNINLSVDTKLSNYSTTNEMNSAITLKANQITSSVSQSYATKTELTNARTEIQQTTDSISSTVATKVGNNEIISRINQTPETYTIDASKVNVSGVITAINNDTSTTINGNKITTGSITASQVNSSIITTSNLSAQTISASQITTGTLSANRISGGTINGNNVSITNLSASNIRSGRLNITSGNYYLRMGFSESDNPSVSGLNVGRYGIKASSGIAATSFAITNSDTGKSVSLQVPRQGGGWYYITFTGGILTAWERKS